MLPHEATPRQAPHLITASFDGCAEPNPGPAACGVIITGATGQTVAKIGRFLGHRLTNNQAEWTALGIALRWLVDNKEIVRSEPTELAIRGDSKLVINQLSGEWACRKPHLIRLRDRCRNLLAELGIPWRAVWVPREQNAAADALAARAWEEAIGRPLPQRRRVNA